MTSPIFISAMRGRNEFVRHVACLTTGPQRLGKPVLDRVGSDASSVNFQYLLIAHPVVACVFFLNFLSLLSFS